VFRFCHSLFLFVSPYLFLYILFPSFLSLFNPLSKSFLNNYVVFPVFIVGFYLSSIFFSVSLIFVSYLVPLTPGLLTFRSITTFCEVVSLRGTQHVELLGGFLDTQPKPIHHPVFHLTSPPPKKLLLAFAGANVISLAFELSRSCPAFQFHRLSLAHSHILVLHRVPVSQTFTFTRLNFRPEDGGGVFPLSGACVPDYTASDSKRRSSL
jgi:hypothetical protein